MNICLINIYMLHKYILSKSASQPKIAVLYAFFVLTEHSFIWLKFWYKLLHMNLSDRKFLKDFYIVDAGW